MCPVVVAEGGQMVSSFCTHGSCPVQICFPGLNCEGAAERRVRGRGSEIQKNVDN